MSHDHRHGIEECKELFERLSEYIDGELPQDLCSHIEGHMEDCPPCVAFLRSLRQAVDLVGDLEAPAMPDEVRGAVREAWRKLRDGLE